MSTAARPEARMPHQVHAWLDSAEKTSGALDFLGSEPKFSQPKPDASGATHGIAKKWVSGPNKSSFGRLWRVFMTARVAIAGVLVVLQGFIHALGNATNGWSIVVCLAYLCAALAVRLWARPRPPGSTFDAHWASTIGVDVVTFSVLNFLQSGGVNYTPLFALPVLLSSVLGP